MYIFLQYTVYVLFLILVQWDDIDTLKQFLRLSLVECISSRQVDMWGH